MKMHYLLIVVFSLIIISCSSSKIDRYPKEINVYGYDFTSYTAKGFLFTPEKYLGEYESRGLLEIEIFPELNYVQPKGVFLKPGQFYNDTARVDISENTAGGWFYIPVSAPEVLDSLYNYSRKLGADAVVNLSITEVEKTNGGLLFVGKKASGFAIKRK